MKRYIILTLLGLTVFSCVSNDINKSNDSDVSLELNTTIIKAADDITGKLHPGTKVALYNTSTEESELTNYVIEEIATILVQRGELIIVDRKNLDNIITESNFQMSGAVRDEDIRSIAHKYGAESVVSCSINGTGILQRLRVRTLDVETGIVQSLTSHAINGVNNQSIRTQNAGTNSNTSTYQTIRENGITVDFLYDELAISFEVYIDGTNYIFIIVFDYQDNGITYGFINESDELKTMATGTGFTATYMIQDRLFSFLNQQNVDTRTAYNISRIIINKAQSIFRK